MSNRMDRISLFLETAKHDVDTENNFKDSFEVEKFTLPFSEDFAKVVKEVLDTDATEHQTVH